MKINEVKKPLKLPKQENYTAPRYQHSRSRTSFYLDITLSLVLRTRSKKVGSDISENLEVTLWRINSQHTQTSRIFSIVAMTNLNDKVGASEIENAKGYDSFVEDLNNNVEARIRNPLKGIPSDVFLHQVEALASEKDLIDVLSTLAVDTAFSCAGWFRVAVRRSPAFAPSFGSIPMPSASGRLLDSTDTSSLHSPLSFLRTTTDSNTG
ncbi:hypothetical protein G7Y89_g10971 [Cudoniella acicularis]|uniref:Uncharacterized protein n=1 Tax=Cudoniella acicularis TaxID=354080 RepID=A0A8H4REF1_9HELO|nr:hypothetical protein G7Y89_g10971 [Cudoniella acicularis]